MLLLLTTTACSTYRRQFDANPPFAPHYHRNFDVEVAWQAEKAGRDVQLAGTVANRRDAYLQDMVLTVWLFDEKGKVLAKERIEDFSRYIPPGKKEPFVFNLRIPDITIPARLRFNYTYFLAQEAPDFRQYGDIPRSGKFDAPL
jgi:hypothetical protein